MLCIRFFFKDAPRKCRGAEWHSFELACDLFEGCERSPCMIVQALHGCTLIRPFLVHVGGLKYLSWPAQARVMYLWRCKRRFIQSFKQSSLHTDCTYRHHHGAVAIYGAYTEMFRFIQSSNIAAWLKDCTGTITVELQFMEDIQRKCQEDRRHDILNMCV